MTAPAWKGSVVTGLCARCGSPEEIKDPSVLSSPETHERGYCTTCDRIVDWIVWDGPVKPI